MSKQATKSGWRTANGSGMTTNGAKPRSKYQGRNRNHDLKTEEEAKQHIQELEEKNDAILDDCLKTSYQTLDKAENTAVKLSAQREQLQRTDKNMHETEEELKQTKGLLGGMKSIGGMIKRKFTPQKRKADYVAPVATKSAMERRKEQRMMDKYGKNSGNGNGSGKKSGHNGKQPDPNKLGYEANKREDAKMDELIGNIKQMTQMGHDVSAEIDEQDQIIDAIGQKMGRVQPEMAEQNHTMHKIVH